MQVRYVIDYYDVPEQQGNDRVPELDDGEDAVSIALDDLPKTLFKPPNL